MVCGSAFESGRRIGFRACSVDRIARVFVRASSVDGIASVVGGSDRGRLVGFVSSFCCNLTVISLFVWVF